MKKLTIIALLLIFSCSKENVEYESNQLTETEIILSSFEGTYYGGINQAGYIRKYIVISSGKIEIDDIWYGLMVESENKLTIYIIDDFDISYEYLSVEKPTGGCECWDLYLNIHRPGSFYFESYKKIE
jgi:hypothetical protein